MSTIDFLWFVDKALDDMVSILELLGEELANRRPALDGANSAVATVTHCLGVMEFWGGYAVAGRSIERDREAEFRASGPLADLIERVRASRRPASTGWPLRSAGSRTKTPAPPCARKQACSSTSWKS
jgi:hypothetical protein